MKRVLVSLLTLVLILICVIAMPIGTHAANEEYLTFILNPDGETCTVTDCSTSVSGAFEIPSSYNGKLVTGIGSSAFSNCDSLTSITIPDSVTSIGSSAFYDCDGLTSITIPDSVTSIGYDAFIWCSSLTSVYITDLAAWCNISFGNGFANPLYYADNLYLNGELVTNLVIPDSVTAISKYAFYGCNGLTSITIPDSVTSIGSYAFYDCSSLQSITIPDSVTSIGDYAFKSCSRLISITIPDSITSIDKNAFEGCDNLKYNQYDNAKYLGNANNEYALLVEALSGEIDSCEIYNNTKTIAKYAFQNCTWLSSIDIPNSVTSIGSSAFSGCNNLRSITIPFVGGSRKTSSDTYQYPFGYIFGTTSYTGGTATTQYYYGSSTSSTTSTTFHIPSNLKSVTVTGGNILYGAFYNCSNLTSITIGDSVTSIGYEAFYNCTSLTNVTISDSVTSIGRSAFSRCSSLESITIPFVGGSRKTASDTYQYPFGYIFSTYSYSGGVATEQHYCSSTSSVISNTYYIPSSLKSVTVTGGSIPLGAFEGCENLTSITIPDTVTSIGSYAFEDCRNLTSITIPDSVTSIGNRVFSGCSSLNYNTYDNGKYLGNSENMYIVLIGTVSNDITSCQIHANSKFIGSFAFEACRNLTSITIPESVTSIGEAAFRSCSSLTSITLPDSVTSIGYCAFSGCSSLNHVAYIGTQTQWNSISIDSTSTNTNLFSTTRHYETRFQNVDNCVETGVYCPVCELFITRTVKEGGTHTYTDGLDVACNACDYIRTATGLSILQFPEKLGYVLFEDALDVTGGQLQLTYDDGSVYTIAMTLDMVTGFDNTVIGIQNLTVACGGLTATYTVEIAAQVPERVQIESLPDKLSYVTGDTLDLTGLTLTAIYKDGQQATVTAADAQVFADMTTVGVKTVTVTFQGKQATFEIYVHPRGAMATVDNSLYPESAHNYSNNINETKTLTVPGATKIVLTFNSSSATESNYDYVYVLDGSGNQIGKYSGSLAGKVVTVSGDTVKIRLTSDSSNVKYGYAFSKIEADIGMTHPEVVIPSYPATFARPGLTEGTKCEICGEMLRQQQEIPQLVGRVANWNMTVADDLKVNFYLEISDEIVSTTTVSLIINGEIQGYRASDLTETADGTYLVTANISAAQMNDDIVIMISSGSYLTTSATYSAKQYCDTLLGDEQYSRYHALVKEMLNYGAMAQLYFDYGADDLVNNNITGAAKEDIPEQAENDMAISGSIESISFYGASLVFKDRIAVRYYFRYDGDLAQYSFSAGDLPITYIIKDGMLCIEVADILPQNLDQQITLTVTDADGSELSVTYGPMNYIVRMNQKDNVNLKNLLKALYNYHLAAKQLSETTA